LIRQSCIMMVPNLLQNFEKELYLPADYTLSGGLRLPPGS